MQPIFAGIRVAHPERVIYPAEELTKRDLVRYYDTVGDWMLPHLRGRPLTLKQSCSISIQDQPCPGAKWLTPRGSCASLSRRSTSSRGSRRQG